MYSSSTKAQGKCPWAGQVKKEQSDISARETQTHGAFSRWRTVPPHPDTSYVANEEDPPLCSMKGTKFLQGSQWDPWGRPPHPRLHWGGSLVSGKTSLGEEPECASLTLWSSERASHLTWRRRKVLYFPLALGPASPTAEGGGCPPSLTPTP